MSSIPGTTRRTALTVLGATTVGASLMGGGPVGAAQAAGTTHLRLRFSDANGNAMGLAAVRSIQSHGLGEVGYDDALLDSSTLEVVAIAPLYQDESGAISLDAPTGRSCTLTMSWPTSHGYSALMVDLPASGEVEVMEAAARSLHSRQEARAAGVSDAALASARATTGAELTACQKAASATQRGAHAVRALESASTAQLALDGALSTTAPGDSVLGVTFTRPPSSAEASGLAGRLGGAGRTAVRIVVEDPGDAAAMAQWRGAVTTLQAQGIRVVGQICDSRIMAGLDDAAWDRRVSTLLTGLPGLETWEIGNELGGNWLGASPLPRIIRAAKAVRQRTKATTLLTLYYQLGLDSAEHSVFNTARAVAASELAGLVDVVGLSVYPQWHPLGTAADRVLSALAATFPKARTAVTELGYGGPSLSGPWWFGSKTDVAAGRRAVIDHITKAALGRPGAWGAPFWWYYLEDEAPGAVGGPVQPTLARLKPA
ncbi:Tat pathway signal sequence [Actinomyces slackii]|uniref:Tat pathway signal sequence n=2 Tax=Actinomyces slackii TaxID=52774 RepID=A0A3S4SLF4_9ACTO|nr:Uncharacterised protein [Actinomyces slackii]